MLGEGDFTELPDIFSGLHIVVADLWPPEYEQSRKKRPDGANRPVFACFEGCAT